MNKKIKILLMDDIHLEGRPYETHIKFHDEISARVETLRSEDYIPIIIFAGDIGEGLAGINWFKSINCDIVYVLGNHEFWGQDYFEEISNMQDTVKKAGYEHIRFLHNDSAIIHGIRFIGGTLWSNIGLDFPWNDKNFVLRYHGIMGDFKRISAKGWYTEENKQRLIEFLTPHDVPVNTINRIIEQETFNPLLEIEENLKTSQYIFKELETPYDGSTIVVTHHLPFREPWIKYFNVPDSFLTRESFNDESVYLDVARGKTAYSDKDLLLLGFYTNNLSSQLQNIKAPEYWVHGHLHKAIDDFILGTNIKSCPVGYHKQSHSLSYKEFNAHNNSEEFSKYIIKQIEKHNWNEAILNNLIGFEKIINQFKLLIEQHTISNETFYSIASAFSNNHEFSRKEIEKQITLWMYQIYQWENPTKKLEKITPNTLRELIGFTNFMKTHEYPNDYKIYNIGIKVDEHSFYEKDAFKKLKGEQYKDLRNYHYLAWLKELNLLQLNAIRYKKSLLEFIKTKTVQK